MADGSIGEGQSTLTINQKIVHWAFSKRGQQVKRGECWDLPEEALKKAGAKRSHDFTSSENFDDADYKWSDIEINVKDAQPGDIIQFRDFISTTSQSNGRSETLERGHHSAIILQNRGSGRLVVLEQNVKPLGQKTISKRVRRTEINVLDGVVFTDGDPSVPNSSSVSVSGKIWVFRPTN